MIDPIRSWLTEEEFIESLDSFDLPDDYEPLDIDCHDDFCYVDWDEDIEKD